MCRGTPAKKSYGSKRAAKRALMRVRADLRGADRCPVRVYRCPDRLCGRYHLTHLTLSEYERKLAA